MRIVAQTNHDLRMTSQSSISSQHAHTFQDSSSVSEEAINSRQSQASNFTSRTYTHRHYLKKNDTFLYCNPINNGYISLTGDLLFDLHTFRILKEDAHVRENFQNRSNGGAICVSTHSTTRDTDPKIHTRQEEWTATENITFKTLDESQISIFSLSIEIRMPTEWQDSFVVLDWSYDNLDGEYCLIACVFKEKDCCSHNNSKINTRSKSKIRPKHSQKKLDSNRTDVGSESCHIQVEWWKLNFRNATFNSWETLQSTNDVYFHKIDEKLVSFCSNYFQKLFYEQEELQVQCKVLNPKNKIDNLRNMNFKHVGNIHNPSDASKENDHENPRSIPSPISRYCLHTPILQIIDGPGIIIAQEGVVHFIDCEPEHILWRNVNYLGYNQEEEYFILQKSLEVKEGDNQLELEKDQLSTIISFRDVNTSFLDDGEIIFYDKKSGIIWDAPFSLQQYNSPSIHFYFHDTFSGNILLQSIDMRLFLVNNQGQVKNLAKMNEYVRSASFSSYPHSIHHNNIDILLVLTYYNCTRIDLFELEPLKYMCSVPMNDSATTIPRELSNDNIQLLLLCTPTCYKLLYDSGQRIGNEEQSSTEEDHLFTVARAMKTQQDEIQQEIIRIENVFQEKEKMIYHQMALMNSILFEQEDLKYSNSTEVSGLQLYKNDTKISEGFSSIDFFSTILQPELQSLGIHASFYLVAKEYSIRSNLLSIEIIVRFSETIPSEEIIFVPFSSIDKKFTIFQEVIEKSEDSRTLEMRGVFTCELPQYFGDDFLIEILVAQYNTLLNKKAFRYLTHIQPTPLRKTLAFSQLGTMQGSPWSFSFAIQTPLREGLHYLYECMRQVQMRPLQSNQPTHLEFKTGPTAAEMKVKIKIFKDGFLIEIYSFEENAEFVISLIHILREIFPTETKMYPFGGTIPLLQRIEKICSSLNNEYKQLEKHLKDEPFNVGNLKYSLFEAQLKTEKLYTALIDEKIRYIQ